MVLGLDRETFWDMTPAKYKSYHDEFLKIEKHKFRQTDLLNHQLGQYIMIGVNEPKKYPQKPRFAEDHEPEVMTDEQMEKRARRNTIRMGGTIK